MQTGDRSQGNPSDETEKVENRCTRRKKKPYFDKLII
jgi:hypothetical protein